MPAMETPSPSPTPQLRPSAVAIPAIVVHHSSCNAPHDDSRVLPSTSAAMCEELLTSAVVPSSVAGLDMVVSFATSSGRTEGFLLATWSSCCTPHRGEVRVQGQSVAWDRNKACLVKRIPLFGKELSAASIHAAPCDSDSSAASVTLVVMTSCWSVVMHCGHLKTHPTLLTTEWVPGEVAWSYLPVATGASLWLETFGPDAVDIKVSVAQILAIPTTGNVALLVTLASPSRRTSLLLGGWCDDGGQLMWAVAPLSFYCSAAGGQHRIGHMSVLMLAEPSRSTDEEQQVGTYEAQVYSLQLDAADDVQQVASLRRWVHTTCTTVPSPLTLSASARLCWDGPSGFAVLYHERGGASSLLRAGASPFAPVVLTHSSTWGARIIEDNERVVIVLLTAEFSLMSLTTAEVFGWGAPHSQHHSSATDCVVRRLDHWPLQHVAARPTGEQCRTVVANAHHKSSAAALGGIVVVQWE